MNESIRTSKMNETMRLSHRDFRANDRLFINLIHKQTLFSLKPESRPKKQEAEPLRISGGLDDPRNLKHLWILQPAKGQRY